MNTKAMSSKALKAWEADLREVINKTGADYTTTQGTKLIDAYYSIKLELDSREDDYDEWTDPEFINLDGEPIESDLE